MGKGNATPVYTNGTMEGAVMEVVTEMAAREYRLYLQRERERALARVRDIDRLLGNTADKE